MRKYSTKKSKYAAHMQPIKLSKIRHSQGFTLIEALVTVIVMSIGLLGVAALQNTSIKLTYDSYLRTQSSLLASDLFDRMRSNLSTDYDSVTYTSTTPANSCSRADDECDPDEMAEYDAATWLGRVQEVFGDGDGIISVSVTRAANTEATDNFSEGITGADTFAINFTWSPRVNDAAGNDNTQQFTYIARVGNDLPELLP